jgi:hypothetical protein
LHRHSLIYTHTAAGNLVSEFGILPWDRKANEEFVAGFALSYSLYEQRIGAPSSVNLARGTRYESGAVVRVLKVWPQQYQVHVMAADGTSQVRVGVRWRRLGGTHGGWGCVTGVLSDWHPHGGEPNRRIVSRRGGSNHNA